MTQANATRPDGSEFSAELGQVPERWYCVSTDGMAMLCKDERDASLQAAESDALYPAHAPHRAVRLGDVAAERERARQALSDRLAGTVMSKYASKDECEAARAALRNAMLDVCGA